MVPATFDGVIEKGPTSIGDASMVGPSLRNTRAALLQPAAGAAHALHRDAEYSFAFAATCEKWAETPEGMTIAMGLERSVMAMLVAADIEWVSLQDSWETTNSQHETEVRLLQNANEPALFMPTGGLPRTLRSNARVSLLQQGTNQNSQSKDCVGGVSPKG
jgi:hypothetical protein